MFFTQKHKPGEKSAVDWTAFARLAEENAAIGALRDVTDTASNEAKHGRCDVVNRLVALVAQK